MSNEKEGTEKGKLVPIEFKISEDMDVDFANFLLINHTTDEFFLNFFQVAPPIQPRGKQEKQQDIKEVKSQAVARICIPATRMKEFINTQKRNYKKYEEMKEK